MEVCGIEQDPGTINVILIQAIFVRDFILSSTPKKVQMMYLKNTFDAQIFSGWSNKVSNVTVKDNISVSFLIWELLTFLGT